MFQWTSAFQCRILCLQWIKGKIVYIYTPEVKQLPLDMQESQSSIDATALWSTRGIFFRGLVRTQEFFFIETLPDLGCNFLVSHFINGLNADDAASEILFFKPVFQFVFRLPRTKDQD